MTAAVLLAAVLAALLLQRLFLRHSLDWVEIDYGFAHPAAEPEGEETLFLRFRNRSWLFLPYVRYQLALPEGFGAEAADGTLWLAPRQLLLREIPLRTPGRGRYLLRSLTVWGGDFLGLEETRTVLQHFRELVVYPKEAVCGKLDALSGSLLGELSVRRFLFEDPVLTLGFRDYTGREPMKSIAWAQSARRGALTVKNYDRTTDPSVTVVVNVSYVGPQAGEAVERCFSLARAVCARLERQGVKYGLLMNAMVAGSARRAIRIPEGMGHRHFYGVLDALGRAGDSPGCPPEKLAEELLQGNGTHGAVFITPERDADTAAAVQKLLRGGLTVVTLSSREMT